MVEQQITLALDARTIHRPVRRGTGRNLLDLYRNVLRLRPQWRIVGFFRGRDEAGLPDARYQPRRMEMRGDRFGAWGRWRLPLAAWTEGADLLHCPANQCPAWLATPTLLTVHDLMPLEGPAGEVRRFARGVHRAVRAGLSIITPSQYTAQQVVERFGAQPHQLRVIPWAADSSMHRLRDETALDVTGRKYGCDGRVVLHLGAAQARKNTARLIEAFALVPEAVRRDWMLLIVGVEEEAARHRFAEQAAALRIGQAVRVHGFAPADELPALFHLADVLAYPSLSEGFGLPILDAWATDTAVLAANATSLPEVGDDAALYVDPAEIDDISFGLHRLLDSQSLRRVLIDRGRLRSHRYTWQATAERFVETVEQTLQRAERGRRAA